MGWRGRDSSDSGQGETANCCEHGDELKLIHIVCDFLNTTQTTDHQSTQQVHVTVMALNLQHVSVRHQTIFRDKTQHQ